MTSAVLLLTVLSAPYNGAPDSVRLYNDLGNYHRTISTRLTSAQRYFDQGVRLAYGLTGSLW